MGISFRGVELSIKNPKWNLQLIFFNWARNIQPSEDWEGYIQKWNNIEYFLRGNLKRLLFSENLGFQNAENSEAPLLGDIPISGPTWNMYVNISFGCKPSVFSVS